MSIECKVYSNFERTTDDRHNKKYYRSCSVTYYCDLEGLEVDRELFRYHNEFEKFFGQDFSPKTKDQALSSVLKELYEEELESEDSVFEPVKELGKEAVKPRFMLRHYNDYASKKEDGYIRMSFEWKEHAERPSEIISEDEARAKFPTEEVREWYVNAIERAAEIVNERHRKLEIMRDTEALAKWIANASREEAEESTSYKSKLEALQAEFTERLKSLKSEVKAKAHKHAADILDEWEDRHVEEAIEADYCEESTKHAPKFWQRYLRAPDGGYKTRRVFGTQPNETKESKIKPEEVLKD